MAIAISAPLQRLGKHRYVRMLRAFGSWWKEHLVAGLPPQAARLFRQRSERLLARLGDGEVLMWRDGETIEELGRFRLDDEPTVAQQRVAAALARLDEDHRRAWFLVEESDVLIHRLTMPAATEDNLRQVLTYEMDRYTPFTADQVYFDYRIAERRETERQIRVELIAVRRATLDNVLRGLNERGLVLHGIDVARERDNGVLAVLDVNLLPPERRASSSRRHMKLNLALGLIFVVLLYGVMWQSLQSREKAVEAFRQATSEAQSQAQGVATLRNELLEAREAARFLSEKKAEHPVVMNVLQAVTAALPDDVWIQRLQITQGKVQLTGQAPEAATLIGLLEAVECLRDPSPKGAFTPDSQSGKERFTIEVFVGCPGGANATATAG